MEDFPRVDCPIGLFPKQEGKIRDLTLRINKVAGIKQKAELARALREAVEVLRQCSASDESNIHCVNCQVISRIRSRTATLILKADEALNWASKA